MARGIRRRGNYNVTSPGHFHEHWKGKTFFCTREPRGEKKGGRKEGNFGRCPFPLFQAGVSYIVPAIEGRFRRRVAALGKKGERGKSLR